MAASRDLIAEDLGCRRGARRIFARLSFRLSAGGALVLTGSNGSGKTSLLRLLAGLIAPAAGRLAWGAIAIADQIAEHHARLHYVGHQDAVKPGLTPRETLAFWAALQGRERLREAVLIDPALSAFALEPVADWPCRWLSAGQRRRLALSRLFAIPAALWLLDEPLAALDHDNQLCLERAIAEHRGALGRVVLATHTPIEMDGAARLVLDAFAPPPGEVADG